MRGRLLRFACASSILFWMIFVAQDAQGRISCLRGFVFDPNGNPVAGADLDFDDAITGERLYTPGDNTDPTGFYTVCVPNGIYNISYAPPLHTHLLGFQIFNVTLHADSVINVTLDFGNVISGNLRGANGDTLPEVDLDADNLATGRRIYTPNDNSDSLSGDYWIVVPPGYYRVRYQPPLGTRWIGLQLDSVSVLADIVIDTVLYQGMLFSGHVTDTGGSGLQDIKVDLRHQDTGEKIYLANEKTDSTGYYNVAAPTGLFQLRYVPFSGSRYVGVEIDSFTIDSDIVRDQVLEAGWLLSGFVHDSTGNPIADADFDIIQESSGIKLYTPNDRTDTLGHATLTLATDTYTIRVQPPPGTIFDRLVVPGVLISADTSMDFLLPEVPKVNVTGRITDPAGTGLPDIAIDFSDTLFGSRVYVADNTSDSMGNYDMFVPIGSFNVEIAPPPGSRYVGRAIGAVTVAQDTIWDIIVLETGYIVSAQVLGPQGDPVEGADFDFILENTGETIFTPHDNTDPQGHAEITVFPGIYTIDLTPPAGSSLEPILSTGIDIGSDTSMTFFFSEAGKETSRAFLLKSNFPNPFDKRRDKTSFSYVLFRETTASLQIYNSLGQRVRRFNFGRQQPGYYVVDWNGRDDEGRSVASGVYLYRLDTGMGSDTNKMLLVR